MEWTTLQHLDLRHIGRGVRPLQPHAACFHHHQALVAVAIGTYIVELDALTGSKISALGVGAPVVRMSYSPTSGHTVIAILQDCTIRSCDFDLEQTCVLHSPEKKTEQISSDSEVHMALTPLQPVVFFGFHKRMSVTVVGTVEGGRAPTKIKTDLKKPIVNLACHPRLPILYVAYAEGLIRAYNIQSYAIHYTLQLDNTIKLVGAGAFAFHPTLEWVFVGDRRGTLLAWDVSTERPSMIGIKQVGSQPIKSVAWLPMLRLLVTLSKDGNLQVWETRITVNPNRPPMAANFFEPAAIESIDVPRLLSQQGGEAVYPLPRIKAIEFHPKSNLAALVFANVTSADTSKNKAAYSREGRKQLFAVLQSARGSSASVLREKLSALGSSGVLADHQLQAKLQEHTLKGRSHLTISDIARKAFLYSHFMEGHAKISPISRVPLITVLDTKHHLNDFPVCEPFHLELNFFNKANRVLHYPARAFYVDGLNLMAHNLSSGSDSIYRKLYNSIPGSVEYRAKYLVYSKKQRLFLVVYEFSGATNEVVFYWENTDAQTANSKSSTVKGRDAAFIGSNENQFAILDDDRTGLAVYTLPGGASKEAKDNDKVFEENQPAETSVGSIRGPTPFMFETEVDRIFSTPIDSTLMFASHGNQIGQVKLIQGYRLSTSTANGHYISTNSEGKKSIKLKRNEIVLQVHWQETLRGYVAGILTTHRVLIVSAALDILAGTSTNFDKGLPSYRSLLWVGPALLFSTATAISILGWDGKVRSILSISMPYAVLVGSLNDRLLLANPTEINPRQKKGVEIKSCLVGLLEPILIGFVTMQLSFEQKLDLSEILYQITSRFDSLRITPRSLDILARGSPVCGDLAVSLSQSGPHFTQVMRGVYAVKALRFSTALSVLKDEFLRSRDYPRCPPTSHLFHRFRQLGNACIRFGQFDSAKETFEVIADYESMLDLFICHLNPSAMRRLAQKLEEEGLDSELRRYCERILRVRSSGWTQGIFANFAAESMVPKGPEWGGGNWEIKTPTTVKDIPKWELAAEVTPYMKTDEGTIPSIIVDHIGVYLGLIRGRGNIVEVREDSLVKAFMPGGNENKLNGLEASSVKSISNQSDVNPRGGSMMGLESLNKQLASSSADEQAKAEEEFKKSMYGAADGSSSDEEGVSKKKIHIKIRDPISSSTVDVNKIKEATRQLKLGEGLPPPTRTRSSISGNQDLGQIQTCHPIKTLPLAWTPRNNHHYRTHRHHPPPPKSAASALPAPLKSRKTHSMPPEKMEIFKSLESWATDSVLPLLKPVEECWQPQQFVPDSSLPFDEFTDQVKELRERTKELPDEYFVVLVGDMVTEDALPTYQSMINKLDGVGDEIGSSPSPWAVWTRAWTAEENRHGDLLRTYLYLSGRVDMTRIEKTVQYLIKAGMDPGTENNPYLGFVYTSFQERATFVSHGNTARLAREGGDPVLARICGTIAADEKRHENAYARIVEKLLEVDPDGAMVAIGDMMAKKITMPAHLMYDGQDPRLFEHFAAVAQRTGVYTANDYADILENLIERWRLEKLVGLNGEGRKAQDFVCGLAPRIRRLQERADERARKMKPQGVKFSWIFNNEVVL